VRSSRVWIEEYRRGVGDKMEDGDSLDRAMF
jgi:hypothetical protein